MAIQSTAWFLTGCGELTEKSLNLPPLGPKQVMIDFQYCGLCGSDISKFEGRRPGSYPISIGHEFVAVIRSVGSDVIELAVGDVVVSDLNYRCGSCEWCNHQESHLCENGQCGDFSNRGFADAAVIHEEYLIKVNTSSPSLGHSYAEPLSCVLHAYDHANIRPNEKLLVLGAGSLGTCLAMILLDTGQPAMFHDPINQRASSIVESSGQFKRWDKVTRPDVVMDLSGSMDGLLSAVTSVRKGGRVVSMSHLGGYGSSEFLLPTLTRKDVWFIVSYLNGEKSSLTRALDIISRTDPALIRMWTEVLPISELNKAFSKRRVSKANKTVICCVDNLD